MTVGVLTTCHTQYTYSLVYVKDQVFVPPLPPNIPEMKVRIRTAIETITDDMLQAVWNEHDFHVDFCGITKSEHIVLFVI